MCHFIPLAKTLDIFANGFYFSRKLAPNDRLSGFSDSKHQTQCEGEEFRIGEVDANAD